MIWNLGVNTFSGVDIWVWTFRYWYNSEYIFQTFPMTVLFDLVNNHWIAAPLRIEIPPYDTQPS